MYVYMYVWTVEEYKEGEGRGREGDRRHECVLQ